MKVKILLILMSMSALTGCRLIAGSHTANVDMSTQIIVELSTQTPVVTSTPEIESSPTQATSDEASGVGEQNDDTSSAAQDLLCTPQAGNWVEYTVSLGDTLTNIAMRHNVSVIELQQKNCLANANVLFIGQMLLVPPIIVMPTASNIVNLPSVGGVGEPPLEGCSVARNFGIKDVVISNPVDGNVAKLGSYLPLHSVVRNHYGVVLQGYPGDVGYVWDHETHLVGNDCDAIVNPPAQPVEPPMTIPVYGIEGVPPVSQCSVIQSPDVETAFIYATPGAFNALIGQLASSGWLSFVEMNGDGASIRLPDDRIAWIPSNDFVFIGSNCPIS